MSRAPAERSKTTDWLLAPGVEYFTALLPASVSVSSQAPRSASVSPSSPSQAPIWETPDRTAENSQAVSTRKAVRCSAREILAAVFEATRQEVHTIARHLSNKTETDD